MTRKVAKILMLASYVVVFGLMLFFAVNGIIAGIYWTLGIGFVTWMVLVRFLRCPSCGMGQGKGWLWTKFCPHCGAELD